MAQIVCSLHMENNANWQVRSKTKMEGGAIKRASLILKRSPEIKVKNYLFIAVPILILIEFRDGGLGGIGVKKTGREPDALLFYEA